MEILWPFDGSAAGVIYNSGTPGAIRARMREPDSVQKVIIQNVGAAGRGEGPFAGKKLDLEALLNVAEMMRRD